ncbi:MAG: PhzF family phenazine biosynthesis protein [Chloroflexota bacterium]|nr:PhzF family phenazine biosynthesis protein [Chloroflexota bacterium]
MSRRFRFRTVDVFTDRPFRGNPLAVFPDADGLTDAEMQDIAREMNLSETSFVLTPTERGRARGADYRVRFFTPGLELPFAGHPSIGTAWVLADEGRFLVTDPGSEARQEVREVRQELPIGVLPLTLRFAGSGTAKPVIGEVTMTQGAPELLQHLDDDQVNEICEAIQVARETIGWPSAAPDQEVIPAIISTGLAHLVIPLRERALMDDIDRDRTDELAEICEELGVVSAAIVAPGGSGEIPDADASVRIFDSSEMRIDVDPATGAAAGPIAVLLGQAEGTRRGTFRVVLEQGVEIGRPSRLVAEVDFTADGRPGEVRVAGSAVPVMEGWLTLS